MLSIPSALRIDINDAIVELDKCSWLHCLANSISSSGKSSMLEWIWSGVSLKWPVCWLCFPRFDAVELCMRHELVILHSDKFILNWHNPDVSQQYFVLYTLLWIFSFPLNFIPCWHCRVMYCSKLCFWSCFSLFDDRWTRANPLFIAQTFRSVISFCLCSIPL